MRRVRLARAARSDFSAIAKRSEAQWGAEQRAHYVGRIRTAIDRLKAHPQLGPEYGHDRPGLRKLTVGAHIVFYRYNDERVLVLRILDQRVDIEARLGETTDD